MKIILFVLIQFHIYVFLIPHSAISPPIQSVNSAGNLIFKRKNFLTNVLIFRTFRTFKYYFTALKDNLQEMEETLIYFSIFDLSNVIRDICEHQTELISHNLNGIKFKNIHKT